MQAIKKVLIKNGFSKKAPKSPIHLEEQIRTFLSENSTDPSIPKFKRIYELWAEVGKSGIKEVATSLKMNNEDLMEFLSAEVREEVPGILEDEPFHKRILRELKDILKKPISGIAQNWLELMLLAIALVIITGIVQNFLFAA
jgi:hypothetical protein